jgi:hypothetical protein
VSVGTAGLSWVFEAMSRIDATSRADEIVSDADARDNGIIEVREEIASPRSVEGDASPNFETDV